MDDIGIQNIPAGSKLLMLGDWFRKPGEGWQVVCYFFNKEQHNFRKALPIDFLPTLAAGNHFPRLSIENKAQGYTGSFQLPKLSEWEKCHFRDLPKTLHRADEFYDQLENCVIYKIKDGGRTYWLPSSELARILFFHSSEVTRAAVYQGNILQLGKASQTDWIGEVELSANLPAQYLNSLQFRKFFTWLFFVPEAEQSFNSIFSLLNRRSIAIDGAERWSFDFQPPAHLSSCIISYAGFTGTELEKNQIFVREIRSISGVCAPVLETVYFSHPDDDLFLQNDAEVKKNSGLNQSPVHIKALTSSGSSMSKKRRHLIKVGSTGFNFDIDPDMRRSPRHIKGLPKGIQSDLDEFEEQPAEELASLLEMAGDGIGVRADVDNFDPPDLISAPEKILFFQKMLQKLEDDKGWSIHSQLGDVPQKQCRSLHLIGDRPRRYCHVVLERDETTTIQIIEIELTVRKTKKNQQEYESLSTLFFRARDETVTYQNILDELMTCYIDDGLNAMNWKRKFNSQNTIKCAYLGHPDSNIENENDALNSWVSRAAALILDF